MTTPGQPNSGPLPRAAIEAAPAVDPGSRHAQQPVYRRDVSGILGEVVLLTPRIPDPLATAGQYHVVAGDRLDLVAARVLGDPHRFWRLADANPTADIRDLEIPGTDLQLPERP